MTDDHIVLRCAHDGLPELLRAGLLGGYNGAGAWTVILPNLRTGDEQVLVETHEGLHHELQSTSGWGLLAAMSMLLAERGLRPSWLSQVFDDMVSHSTRTHEVFATAVSSAALGLSHTRTLLAGNSEYLGFLDAGLGLVAVAEAPLQLRESAVAAVLRCCMAPRLVVDALGGGFRELRSGNLDYLVHSPDRRLAEFVRLGGPHGWDAVFTELTNRYPDRGGDLGGTDRRELPDDAGRLARLRRFEEEIVLRACYEFTAEVLDSAGLPTIAWDAQADLGRLIIEQVGREDEELSARLTLLTGRRPIADDGLEYDRQRIELRDALRAQLESPPQLADFSMLDADGDPYACAVWLTRAAFARQFATSTDLPDPVVALVVPARTVAGAPMIRVGLLPAETTPGELQRQLGRTALVAVTTHSTLAASDIQRLLIDDEPVFVVMDLPVPWHVNHWISQGGRVRFALTPIIGLSDRLWLAAFVVDLAPGLRFLALGGWVGMAMMSEHLMRRHGERIVVDNQILGDGTELSTSLILSMWCVLEQDALA